jgi:hypothetical protein
MGIENSPREFHLMMYHSLLPYGSLLVLKSTLRASELQVRHFVWKTQKMDVEQLKLRLCNHH